VEIVRNADGSLVVPIPPARRHESDDDPDASSRSDGTTPETAAAPTVSTATGRQEAMSIVNAVATSPHHDVAPAVDALDDPEATAEALRHVLVGGVHSVEDFSAEVAEAEGTEALPAHQTTKIIGEVLAELE
jgi:hypothetical protein